MAGQDRQASQRVALARALEEAPWAFDFFQAVRRLECAHPEFPRLGESTRAQDDPFRLGQEPSLGFAPSALSAFESGRDGPPRLMVRFLGLFGPNGPLPLHLTEYARDRMRNLGDHTFHRFADLFHHRMLALFYRAWARVQPAVQFDRPAADRFAFYLGALVGYGMPSLRNRDALPDHARLHFAGRLAGTSRGPEGLEAMAASFFGIPVRIEEFVGHWVGIPRDDLCRLGTDTAALGRTAMPGTRFWDCQHRFRIVMGPMRLEDYLRMLPGGRSLGRLQAMVRSFVGDELEWDLRLVLRREEIPPLRLGERSHLGWTSWLRSRPTATDAEELVLTPTAMRARAAA